MPSRRCPVANRKCDAQLNRRTKPLPFEERALPKPGCSSSRKVGCADAQVKLDPLVGTGLQWLPKRVRKRRWQGEEALKQLKFARLLGPKSSLNIAPLKGPFAERLQTKMEFRNTL